MKKMTTIGMMIIMLSMSLPAMGAMSISKMRQNARFLTDKMAYELGLSMTTAVNIFLRQTIRSNGIPFELKLNTPNDVTMAAVEEGRKIARNPEIRGCTSIKELRAALEEDIETEV